MKRILEGELGWKTLQAKTAGHSVLYLMRDSSDKHTVLFEFKADGSIAVTYDNETRQVPNRQDLGKALGLLGPATKHDQVRILDQVLEKLVRRHREETQAMVEDMMARFGRGKL